MNPDKINPTLGPLRVAILTSSYLPVLGGVQVLLSGLLHHLEHNFTDLSSKFEVDSIAFLVPRSFKSSELDSLRNIDVHYFDFDGSFKTLWSARRQVERILSNIKANVVHGHHIGIDGILLKSRRGRRAKVLTTHGGDLATNKSFGFGFRLKVSGRIAVYIALRDTTLLAAVSPTMVKIARHFFPEERICILPNANFPEPHVKQSTQKRPRKFQKEGLTILTLGGGRAIKGHANLFRAFSQFLIEQPKAKLLVGASGQGIETLKRSAEELGILANVSFIGDITGQKKADMYTQADIYVNASFFEAFGLTTLEAIQYRTAVVVSNQGGLSDVIEHKQSGYLVNPYEVEEILQGLRFLSHEGQRNKVANKASSIITLFKPEDVVARQFGIYRRALLQNMADLKSLGR